MSLFPLGLGYIGPGTGFTHLFPWAQLLVLIGLISLCELIRISSRWLPGLISRASQATAALTGVFFSLVFGWLLLGWMSFDAIDQIPTLPTLSLVSWFVVGYLALFSLSGIAGLFSLSFKDHAVVRDQE